MKLPPFGKALAERLKHNNPPLYCVVCIGMDAWKRAKRWNESKADTVAMVLPPDTPPASLSWPVEGLPVVVEADEGPSDQLVSDLALELLKAGSLQATLIPKHGPDAPLTRFVWERKKAAA